MPYYFTVCFFLSFLLSNSIPLAYAVDNEVELATLEPEPQKTEIVINSLEGLFSLLAAANKHHNYRSLLTYEASGHISTFKLNHWLQESVAYQQLIFLDGPQRQVLRQQPLQGCHTGSTRWGLWPTSLPESALSAYDLKAIGIERVADRETVIFDILPKDEYRYGYRYNVDRETGLVLRLVTYHKKNIVERVQTVSLDLYSTGVTLQEDHPGYLWRVPEVEPCHTEQFQAGWVATWLPDGFYAVGNRLTAQGEPVLIFADGLVSVSVFIINDQGEDKLNNASARNGATVAVMKPLTGQPRRHIAVVGEVPLETARRIATAIKPR